jgi:hypothetical protein
LNPAEDGEVVHVEHNGEGDEGERGEIAAGKMIGRSAGPHEV